MEQYICIHGHFYQPPRENPWLEAIELQDSAYPYHDWNERITAECYAPNAAARILGKTGLVAELVNNYARMSFNFGPTLLAWMEANAPEVYQTILEADRESQQRLSGHGSALAQAYNHIILPLANRRDRHTQVIWGIRDFEHRFGRRPEGMWLPETAVDLATLTTLAELGIQFTILAPHQALRVRAIGSRKWEDVSGARVDITIPYRLRLPSRRYITVFFYNGPISRAVAFEGLLNNGEDLARRLVSTFREARRPQLVHIATDGETYGHHHRFGEMALAYALRYIETQHLAQITNYGEYLEKYPPAREVEIKENTSWSCVHGIERWRCNCGCNSGAHPGWNQAWRGPLREALDWLRDSVSAGYEDRAAVFLKDPWAARDDYIEVILDRSLPGIDRFLTSHARRKLSEPEKVTVLKLLELQRHALLMYTSDGWFFDELSGIETLQVMQYAARAIQLAEGLFGAAVEPRFLDILERATSNVADLGNGRRIYEQLVKPAAVDLSRVTAHFAISSLLQDQPQPVKVGRYTIDLNQYRSFTNGNSKLSLGRATVTSQITLESGNLAFGVLHSGRRKVVAGVREFQNEETYHNMAQEITGSFAKADFTVVGELLARHFGSSYSLSALFRDEQRRLMELIIESALVDIESTYRRLYADYYPPMRFLTESGKPIPAFRSAAELILNVELRRALASDRPDIEDVTDIMKRVESWKIDLDTAILGYTFRQTLGRAADRFASTPDDPSLLASLAASVSLARSFPFPVDLSKVQNACYLALRGIFPEFRRKAELGDEAAANWVDQFRALGAQLSIEVQ